MLNLTDIQNVAALQPAAVTREVCVLYGRVGARAREGEIQALESEVI